MAPEHPPELVIFDSRFEEGKLKGDLHYIEVPVGERLRVAWEPERQPADFRSVGGGVAYVFNSDRVSCYHVTHDAKPDDLGNFRYRWCEGLNLGIPWIMFALILPKNYTLASPSRHPARAKLFNERLALYWILKGDAFGRTSVTCTLQKFQGDVYSNLIALNRICSPEDPASSNFIQIEDRRADELTSESAVKTWQEKLRFLQEQEAIAADPSQKFALAKHIQEAKAKISELGG